MRKTNNGEKKIGKHGQKQGVLHSKKRIPKQKVSIRGEKGWMSLSQRRRKTEGGAEGTRKKTPMVKSTDSPLLIGLGG